VSDNNGWAGQPGVPLNPEQSGWHWLQGQFSLNKPTPYLWNTFMGVGRWADERLNDPVILAEMKYIRPAFHYNLTPAEVDARLADALKWRNAINDYRTQEWCNPLRDDEEPLHALKRIIKCELTAMALDPAVHKAIQAEIDTARKDALKWHDAINDALAETCQDPIGETETAKDALERLINWRVTLALDPVASKSAADLGAHARREALAEAVRLAKLYAQNALKCAQCGDIRHDYNPGNCSGEKAYRESEEYKKNVLFYGEHSAMRYFEKHLCRPEPMGTDEAFWALAAAVEALSDTPPGMVLVPRELTDDVRRAVWRAQYEYTNERRGHNATAERISELTEARVNDPEQRESDRAGYHALVKAAAEGKGNE